MVRLACMIASALMIVAMTGITTATTFPGATIGQQYMDWSPPLPPTRRGSDSTDGNVFGQAHPEGMLVTQAKGGLGVAGWNLSLVPYDPEVPIFPAVDFVSAVQPVVSSSGVILVADFPSFHKGGVLSALMVRNTTDGKELVSIWTRSSQDLTGIAYFAPLDVFIVEYNATLNVVYPETGKVLGTMDIPPFAQSSFQSTPNLLTCGGTPYAFLQASQGAVAYDMKSMKMAWSTSFNVESLGKNRGVGSFGCGSHDPVFLAAVETCPPLSETCYISGLAGFDATKDDPTPLWTKELSGGTQTFGIASGPSGDMVVVEEKVFLFGWKIRAFSSSGHQMWEVDDPSGGNIFTFIDVGTSIFGTNDATNNGYLIDYTSGKVSTTPIVPAPHKFWQILPWGPIFSSGWGVLCGYGEGQDFSAECVYSNALFL